jgi:hypothetical protein
VAGGVADRGVKGHVGGAAGRAGIPDRQAGVAAAGNLGA